MLLTWKNMLDRHRHEWVTVKMGQDISQSIYVIGCHQLSVQVTFMWRTVFIPRESSPLFHILQDESVTKVLNYSPVYYATYLKQLRPSHFSPHELWQAKQKTPAWVHLKNKNKKHNFCSLRSSVLSFLTSPAVTLTTCNLQSAQSGTTSWPILERRYNILGKKCILA